MRLRQVIKRPQTELRHENPYQLLVAVMLSAQCTDARVNQVTPALFAAFPTVEALAAAEPEDVLPYIRSVSYPNSKARHLVAAARRIRDEFGGAVPSSLKALESLPGVGPKTARVVASVAFGVAALPVDTHVYRVAHRIGLVRRARTPREVERRLKRQLPSHVWGEAHHLLILHGRYTCTARQPRCAQCVLTDLCDHYRRLQRLPAPLTGLDPRQGRYFCKRCRRYFDTPVYRTDRLEVEQVSCLNCGSLQVFDAKTGCSTRRVPDYRVR
ncbi:DNA-(apurinic or apyrimidinic site) lyase /endonuclease III [Rhodothermus profundi]|uniref:Endonuclease III n=2 Tax=Rhodothermus profundi TaxID=633813 RepID=A0A1M6WNG8_9BACT|nr:DNA-(apurinic or apyrimidinic site) lyase /endonuclease III [Rhodothermus profundi]